MEIYKKLQQARNLIKGTETKKKGHNTHSVYDFFTPEQIGELVSNACNEVGILRLFDLKRNEFGLYGEVKLINIDNPEEIIIFDQATDIPKITATNATQQIGGAVTYTSRYMDMTIFDIKDNSLDPDNGENKKTNKPKQEAVSRVLTEPEVNEKWNGKIYKGDSVYIDNVKIKVNEDQLSRLKSHSKYKPNN
jgi:hypothetical protein